MPRKWSKEIVVSAILERHRGGEKLSSDYMQKNCRAVYQAGCAYFGNWRNAIEAAGLKYDDVRILQRVRPIWSKEKITTMIVHMYNEGESLNSNHIQTSNMRLYGASIKYFGGWPQAVTAAGLNYDELRLRKLRTWTKAAIAEEIVRRFNEGLSIRGADVSLQDHGLYQAARRHFGEQGWAKARTLAGFEPIDPDSRIIWTPESVREEILRLYENGIPLNTGTLCKTEYGYILPAACKVFGSWAKAVRAAGLDYSKIRKGPQKGWWTKPRIIMCVQNLEKRGVRLSSKSIQNTHNRLFGAAMRQFGSWSQAVEAAGISYRTHCRIWSTKAWLRRMTEGDYNIILDLATTHARKRRNTS